MLKQQRIAAQRRIEDADVRQPSRPISASVMASTGVASTMTRLTAYIDQTNSGSRNHVMPGMRREWIVTMKLSPVRIEENPVTKTPDDDQHHVGIGEHG